MSVSDAFIGQPLKYGGNQSGHFMISFCVTIWLAELFPLYTIAPAIIGTIYFLTVEWAWQRLKLFWDSVEDSCHVTFGSLVAVLDNDWRVLTVWAALLTFGMWRRT